jgi:hypothetical protein
MASNQESEKLAAFNEFKTALGVYKGIAARGGGDIEEVIPRLGNDLLGCVACDAFDNETRSEPLVERHCGRSVTELSKCLAEVFPPSSVSVAKRSQVLKDAKEVFDEWRSDFGIGGVPEEAEKALSMSLTKLKARQGAIPASVIAILTEYEHLNRDFEQLLGDKELLGGK